MAASLRERLRILADLGGQTPTMAVEVQAHTPNAAGTWHTLRDHLAGTASRAAAFADHFGASELAATAGWLHDVGKCSETFCAYLATCVGEGDAEAKRTFPQRDHKQAGALLARAAHASFGVPLAGLVLGHHGGLHDLEDVRSRLAHAGADPVVAETLARARCALGGDALDHSPAVPAWVTARPTGRQTQQIHARDVEMLFRLIFSALVDADFLDTESHFTPSRPAERVGGRTLAGLEQRFATHRTGSIAGAPATPVNQARNEMYAEVVAAGSRPPGLYQLAAPTGAGKTMIGLGWALRHAAANGLRRIVTAVPFITVTDQVASVYRELLDADEDRVVLEHHSEVAGDDGWAKLAAENWDAPVVVTTTVQLFHSLFSNRTSATRKLHRLAGSVIIVDEAQALPLEVLEPVVDTLRALVERFGASVLIMTATPPTLEHVKSSGGVGAVSLIDEPARFDEAFRRTRITRRKPPMDASEVAAIVADEAQCLCVLNTIRDAQRVTLAVTTGNVLHLSTRLRPVDRRRRIGEIRRRVEAGQPCRVVSTQLVEAGVDLDFPVVLRAMGPLPSLAQVDGRCNRNGLLSEPGETIIFDLVDGGKPPGQYYGIGTKQTEVVWKEGMDRITTSAIADWYRLVLSDPMVATDRRTSDGGSVQAERSCFNYRRVAAAFRLIDEDAVSVAVPWPEGDPDAAAVEAILDRLATPQNRPIGPDQARSLQAVTVQLRRRVAEAAFDDGLAIVVTPWLYRWVGNYDEQMGLDLTPLSQKDLIL